MDSILDETPYPFHKREAQQLFLTLTRIYPTSQAALLLAQRADIDISFINGQQAPAYVWKEILEASATAGLARGLVQQAYDLLHAKSSLRPFLGAC